MGKNVRKNSESRVKEGRTTEEEIRKKKQKYASSEADEIATDIDNLFDQLSHSKKKHKDVIKEAKDISAEVIKEKKSSNKVIGTKHDLFGREDSTSRKRTEEGYLIYTEDELQLAKASGNTPACPFDCECCY